MPPGGRKINHQILAFNQKRIMTTPSTIATGAYFLINAYAKTRKGEEFNLYYARIRYMRNQMVD